MGVVPNRSKVDVLAADQDAQKALDPVTRNLLTGYTTFLVSNDAQRYAGIGPHLTCLGLASVRRVTFRLASCSPYEDLFRHVFCALLRPG